MTDTPKDQDDEFADRGMGAIFDDDDARDHVYDPLAGDGAGDIVLPRSRDIRPLLPTSISDQGRINSCTSQTAALCFKAQLIRQGRPDDPSVSRLQLYYEARSAWGKVDQDVGANTRHAFKALANGACPEPLWPHDTDRWREQPPAACVVAGLDHQALEYLSIPTVLNGRKRPQDAIEFDIKTSIAAGYPVAFAMMRYASFVPDYRGRIPMPDGAARGGHGMVLVGYDDTTAMWRLRNSWGERWGGVYRTKADWAQRRNRRFGGYARISYDHLYQEGRDYWTLRLVEA